MPDLPAGSVILLSEAVMHGTAPWRSDHERRTLLYKYCVSQMAWSRARVLPPPDVPLTPRQQALLTEPADPHTFVPSLFGDGPSVEREGSPCPLHEGKRYERQSARTGVPDPRRRH